jgi:ATP-dependent DNA helicase RecQ
LIHYDKDNKICDEFACDFYSPYHRVSVEINGPHHKKRVNRIGDNQRKSMIKNDTGEDLISIDVCEFTDDAKVGLRINEVIEKLKKAENEQSKLILCTQVSEEEKTAMYVFRFQQLMLQLLEKGHTQDFSVKIQAKNDSLEVVENAFNLACEDLHIWFDNLYALLNKSFDFPKIEVSNDAEIIIDIDIYNRYDDDFYDKDSTVKIRNDYFKYDKDSYACVTGQKDNKNDKNIASKFCQSKNYYKVQTSNLRFDKLSKDDEKHKIALEFFLKNIFGFDSFRPNQLEIIIDGLNPKNGVIGLLPTGSGKSVCYQLVSFLTPGITLVVSPLKLLMDDQKNNLNKRNLIMSAYQLHSKELRNLTVFSENQTKILYITPDRFFNDSFRENIGNIPIGQIVVDEVHCLSEWGHDFRTAYLLLFSFLENSRLSKKVLLMGTSATASPNVIKDIRQEFKKIKDKVVEIKATTIKRPELVYHVYKVEDDKKKDEKLYRMVERAFELQYKTLIFCSYKGDTYTIQSELNEINSLYDAQRYYSGYLNEWYNCADDGDEQKQIAFDKFRTGESKVLAATKAFGMGIDIPDIRQTIHFDIASSVESIYQEMGRAGRDGEISHCSILFLDSQKQKIEKLINEHKQYLSIDKLRQKKSNGKKFKDFGPLNKQLNLLVKDNLDYKEWSRFIYEVYQFLSERTNEEFMLSDFDEYCNHREYKLDSGNDDMKNSFDKALYKLYTLKVIDLWKVSYTNGTENPVYSELKINMLSSEELLKNLHSHIVPFDRKYEYNPQNEGDKLKDFIVALCKWDHEKYLYSRWKSLIALYEMIEALFDVKSTRITVSGRN